MLTLANLFRYMLRGVSRTTPGASTRDMCTASDHHLVEMARQIVPALSPNLYKGQCGRIGVIGGCKEYTGAPYFAAISLLKLGADLSHVFCSEAAAPVIKSYSPELIVHPVLDSSEAVAEISEWLPRLHSLVIGPGLGRDPRLLNNVKGVIEEARKLSIPMVIDADGTFLLSQEPGIIKGYERAILTPNAVEFNRLFESVTGGKVDSGADLQMTVSNLSAALGNVTIVRKGTQDIISNGTEVLVCSREGNQRRCGGQGDLLAGAMGVFTNWAHRADPGPTDHYPPTLLAAYAACMLTRECGRRAYHKYGRSVITTNMIEETQHVFEDLFGSGVSKL